MEMPNNRDYYRTLSAARRAQGLTQSALAKLVGCKQSAVSMMERGQEAALAWSTIKAIAETLDIDITEHAPKSDSAPRPAAPERHYCPTFDCPANTAYAVNGVLYALPRPTGEGTPAPKHCSYCGELVETQCPQCGENMNEGACCILCGTAYIATPEAIPHGADAWAKAQRARLQDLGIS